MQDEVRFAVLLGRLIDLIRTGGAASDDHRAALEALGGLVGPRSLTVRTDGGKLTVENVVIPPDTPFASRLAQQMDAHGIAAIIVGAGAAAVELLHSAHAIALSSANYPVNSDAAQRLREAKVASVFLVTKDAEKTVRERRQVRLTDAIDHLGVFAAEGEGAPSGAMSTAKELEIGSPGKVDAYDELIQRRPSRAGTLATQVGQLPGGEQLQLMNRLETVQHSVSKTLQRNEVAQALEAILTLMKQEQDATTEDAHRAYAITIRRILTSEAVQKIAGYLLDEIYAQDVIKIVRRAGTEGTRIVMNMLASAPTFAERRAYLQALREIEEGADVISGMLGHHEWFVVRNAADLVGELRIKEAVPLLGKAGEHEDARVRLSAALALAKIGTPDAVRFLSKPLRDPDRNVRLSVAKEIKGRGLGALSMLLVTATESEEDPEVLAEYYRALGRIGTPDAVRVLIDVARPGGLLKGRKDPERRKAATEGLVLAAESDAARAALQDLASDRDKAIREAARGAAEQTPD
jgi:HEAT repeat protein